MICSVVLTSIIVLTSILISCEFFLKQGFGFKLRTMSTKIDFYYNSICHVCKSIRTDLKRCGCCKFIGYCCKEHQVADWKIHKQICKILSESNKFVKLERNCGYERWRSYRTYLQYYLQQKLGRELHDYESQMCLFPRNCPVCYHGENLIDCENCFSVAYCSKEHELEHQTKHEKVCQQLKLCLEMDLFLCNKPESNVVFKEIPTNVTCLPDDIIQTTSLFLNTNSSNELEKIVTIDMFSNILTVIFGLQKCELLKNRTFGENKLIIHLIGADIAELSSNWKYNVELLKKWIVDLGQCNLILIGPDLVSIPGEKLVEGEVEIQFVKDYYHNVINAIEVPNLIVALNCGFHEYESQGSSDTWMDSLKFLVDSRAPLLLTSYTQTEMEKDLERLKIYDANILLNTQRNPFSTLRPIRDWDSNENEPFYINGYVAIVKGTE